MTSIKSFLQSRLTQRSSKAVLCTFAAAALAAGCAHHNRTAMYNDKEMTPVGEGPCTAMISAGKVIDQGVTVPCTRKIDVDVLTDVPSGCPSQPLLGGWVQLTMTYTLTAPKPTPAPFKSAKIALARQTTNNSKQTVCVPVQFSKAGNYRVDVEVLGCWTNAELMTLPPLTPPCVH